VAGEHLKAQARRVVTGLNAQRRSYIERDELTPHRLPLPGNTKCDIWRIHGIPAPFRDDDGLDPDELVTLPPKGGLVYRFVAFPPDTEWDRSQGYGDSRGSLSTGNADGDDEGIPGLHVTETVDILTVLTGELVCIMQEGETVLKPGDTVIQRGTKHAWSNRGTEPVTAVSIMVSAGPR
jgi:mannose-6-phosphate isomerase-like protein (cupin superfamily)